MAKNTNTGTNSTNISTGTHISTGPSAWATISSSSAWTVTPKNIYNILGEDFEYEGLPEPNLAIIISSINVMGKPFYDELIKQNVHLDIKIETFLKKKFKELERDRKIDELLK